LLDAQRADSRTLRAVMMVKAKREGLQERVDAIDAELAEAQAVLATISGLTRSGTLSSCSGRRAPARVCTW
jgi:hypothetical protein